MIESVINGDTVLCLYTVITVTGTAVCPLGTAFYLLQMCHTGVMQNKVNSLKHTFICNILTFSAYLTENRLHKHYRHAPVNVV